MFLTTRRLFIAILFLALFVMTVREVADPDFWWHLSAGKYVVETRTIPHVDVFSFTNAGQPWVMHEWLSEVIVYALFVVGSFPLLIIVFAGIIALSFALAFARSDGKPYVAAFAILLAAFATAPTWGVRPQMISLLLTSIFLFILDQWRANDHKNHADDHKSRSYIWLLVPLMLLWVNLHSGYALGIVIIAVYLFGQVAEAIKSQKSVASSQMTEISDQASGISHHSFAPRSSPRVTLTLVFIASIAVVLLNPNGATMFVYPFETLTSRTMQAYIQEWFSPDFHAAEFQPFAWLLLATLAAVAYAGKRVSLTQTILLAGFGYAALRSARNIPIFALVAAPILAAQLWRLVQERGWAKLLAPNTCASRARSVILLNWVVLGVIALAGFVRVGMVVLNQNAVERAKFPAAAVGFLQAQKPDKVYNSYGWGGYVMWRLYPQTRVFIDGRADVYGDVFIEEVFLKTYRGGTDWREPLDRYGVRVVLIEPDAPLASQLARDAAWRKVYEDKQAVVWER